MIAINTLFLSIPLNKFILVVLALKALKILKNINIEKKAVIIYFVSCLINKLRAGNLINRTRRIHEYKATTNIDIIIYLFIIGSSFLIGCYSIYLFNGASYENASPAKVSIIIFIHNICMIVTGEVIPINGPTIDKNKAHTFIVS